MRGTILVKPYHLNLAWNRWVWELIRSGAYDRYLDADPSTFAITFFGTAKGLTWNGGRADSMLTTVSKRQLIRHIHDLNRRHAGFVFVFSGTRLDKEDLDDAECNAILDACRSPLNGVVIASDDLREHIERQYPEYVTQASSILSWHRWKHRHDLSSLYNDYDVVVVPEDLNLEIDQAIGPEHRDRTEIILNTNCIYRCPFHAMHLQYMEEELVRGRAGLPPRPWRLPCLEMRATRSVPEPHVVSPAMIGRMAELGIRWFKFLERTQPPDLQLLERYWCAVEQAASVYVHEMAAEMAEA
jgi:hypothetical protein